MNTTYWRNKVLDSVYQASTGNRFYIGLSSTRPSDDGGNVTEPQGNCGYARVMVDAFSAAALSAVHNTAAITFPQSTATWFPLNAPATYWVLFDGGSSNARVLSAGALAEPISIPSNTTVSIASGKIVITIADAPD